MIYRFIEPRLGQRRLHEWYRRALRVVALLAATILLCSVGLALLDNSSVPVTHKLLQGLWNAVNLVTTLGAFSDFDLRQKVFMLGAMLCVMIIGAYAIGQLTGILSSAEVVAYRENRRMERTLKDLSGHALVLGYVGPGRVLAGRLRQSGHPVVVIDHDPAKTALASDAGYLVIQGDVGLEDDVFRSARIDSARVLFVTTDDTRRALALTLIARALHAQLRIVVTAPDERWGELLRRAGASEIVIADRMLADAMMSHLSSAAVGE